MFKAQLMKTFLLLAAFTEFVSCNGFAMDNAIDNKDRVVIQNVALIPFVSDKGNSDFYKSIKLYGNSEENIKKNYDVYRSHKDKLRQYTQVFSVGKYYLFSSEKIGRIQNMRDSSATTRTCGFAVNVETNQILPFISAPYMSLKEYKNLKALVLIIKHNNLDYMYIMSDEALADGIDVINASKTVQDSIIKFVEHTGISSIGSKEELMQFVK